MQEEVNQKVISLSIQGVKITASVLKAALRKFLEMDNRRKQKATQVKMAEKTGYPIIPMSINNTRNIFEAHRPFIRSAHVVLEYGEPIDPKDLPKEQKKFLGAHCQEIIQNTISKNQSLVYKYDEKSFSDFFLHREQRRTAPGIYFKIPLYFFLFRYHKTSGTLLPMALASGHGAFLS